MSNGQSPEPSREPSPKGLANAQQAVKASSVEHGVAPRTDGELFCAALQGERIYEIGRYQVYSNYTPGETVVFIMKQGEGSRHKYIFATANTHTYIVAAPTDWTERHKDILDWVSRASSEYATCKGGGMVTINEDGSLRVWGLSAAFGQGDHRRAEEAFREAVRITGEQQSAHE
jgi:hypothetical protein